VGKVLNDMRQLPSLVEQVLQLDTRIEALAEKFVEKHHTLFLGRGPQYPIAMEGALKLKEISYIHAEAYPAGELKHGPLALVGKVLNDMRQLPSLVEQVLQLDTRIEALAEKFVEKHHTLFLGRGPQYPIAMEGALKLKEISYIHAEAYPAGELKHGPLALVD